MYALQNVSKIYSANGRTVHALRDVDLEVAAGDFIVIQGPTGGGKSTLLQILGALDQPTSGTIGLGGREVSGLRSKELAALRAQDIGFVFQNFNLIPTLTALQNVATALVPLHLPRSQRRTRALAALDAVGLTDRTDHVPGELSGGQQQRVAIARALVKDPQVLLADEPTGNLDEQTRDEIIEIFEQLWREQGLTVILVTHDSWVARRANRRLRIVDGTVTDVKPLVPRSPGREPDALRSVVAPAGGGT